jgi:zinc transport system substrate-binding protein
MTCLLPTRPPRASPFARTLSASAAAALLAGTASADVPRVAADIAPVHSLVARVMDGVGIPDLILPPGASPHEYSLRPSEAAALQEADLVFWVGADLTPWLEDAIGTLAEDARVTALLEADGIDLLDLREDALFEAHDHDHGHAGEHEHDHAEDATADDHDHDDHAHDADGHDEHAHDEHAHDEHGHDEHAHGAQDPHAWLSPDNAAIWLNAIAGALSAADPENAGAYFANAAAGREEMAALRSEVDGMLGPVRDGRFIVFHDAYQYFESAFEIPAAGAISLSDASEPGPARVAEIQARIRAEGIDCVLAEPQYNPAMVATVLDGTEAATGVLDPLGVGLETGPGLYPDLIRGLARELAGCLATG